MELRDFVQLGLDRATRATLEAIDGLTLDEMRWQPAGGANSIGLILFHQARSEDSSVQVRIQGRPQVWEAGRWYERMNLAAGEVGAHYTADQVDSFRVPEAKQIISYGETVRAHSLEYLKSVTNDRFDVTVTHPRLGSISIGEVFARLVAHLSMHAGEISYLRGLQRGLDR